MDEDKEILVNRLLNLAEEQINVHYIKQVIYRPFDKKYTYYIE